jgi:segregation and condensation protein A
VDDVLQHAARAAQGGVAVRAVHGVHDGVAQEVLRGAHAHPGVGYRLGARDRGGGEVEPAAAEPATGPGLEDEREVEPVELLVGLAERGEIDPWDIDIVQVTDAFLAELDVRDLRTSGRALLYASVLLRMKSDDLLAPEQEEAAEPFPAGPTMGMEPTPTTSDPIDGLEREIERRLERKHARGSPKTLDHLIRELRDAERGSWWKESREYDTSASPRGFQRGTQTLDYHADDGFRDEFEPTEEDVVGTAHGEDIEEIVEAVAKALQVHYDAGRAEVLFAEIDEVGGSRVMTFLALLFLSHRGRVHLQQDELFDDLWIQNPMAVHGSESSGEPGLAD